MIKINHETKLVVLTGAGISAESGIKTFRDSGGLWENHRVDDVASLEGFARNPKLVWNFYRERYLQAQNAHPNPGHFALVALEKELGDNFRMITQNVDGLHLAAGSQNVHEMHGALRNIKCTSCSRQFQMDEIDPDIPLPHCECGAMLRPDIVWFGEIPYFLEQIENDLRQCDLFIVIGTSGAVYPAAGFLMTAKYFGAHTLAINLDTPDNRSYLDDFYQGKAGEILPKLVSEWLENY